MKIILGTSLLALGLVLGGATSASAVTFDVQSAANSTGGGVGFDTGVDLVAGEIFRVTAGLGDTWSLGSDDPVSRETNADGLQTYYGNYSQGNLSALYGTLVGQIGNGDFFVLGTLFNGPAVASGRLYLWNWDSNTGDNSGSIAVNVSTVPVPPALLLLGSGLLGLGTLARRRKNT